MPFFFRICGTPLKPAEKFGQLIFHWMRLSNVLNLFISEKTLSHAAQFICIPFMIPKEILADFTAGLDLGCLFGVFDEILDQKRVEMFVKFQNFSIIYSWVIIPEVSRIFCTATLFLLK